MNTLFMVQKNFYSFNILFIYSIFIMFYISWIQTLFSSSNSTISRFHCQLPWDGQSCPMDPDSQCWSSSLVLPASWSHESLKLENKIKGWLPPSWSHISSFHCEKKFLFLKWEISWTHRAHRSASPSIWTGNPCLWKKFIKVLNS